MSEYAHKGLQNGFTYFLKKGIIKSVKLPAFGTVTLILQDGEVVQVETKTKEKI